jgi:integration host factor subunit alpha
MALIKSEIVTSVHDLGFTKKKSVEVIESLLEIIKRTLESSDDVLISGFGKFCVKDKAKRRGRNPATGEDLMLRGRKVVTFKCSGKLRHKIDGLEY